jgi:hypothetical protein
MTLPTYENIQLIGNNLATTLGGGVHLGPTDLAFAVDSAFPGMTDQEFKAVQGTCTTVATQIRRDALRKLCS